MRATVMRDKSERGGLCIGIPMVLLEFAINAERVFLRRMGVWVVNADCLKNKWQMLDNIWERGKNK